MTDNQNSSILGLYCIVATNKCSACFH